MTSDGVVLDLNNDSCTFSDTGLSCSGNLRRNIHKPCRVRY